ncbi:hypothetical protein BDV38DRAFT_248650 [Aspergillus pseudotamarii]|uniref:Uncharacterized protein n=1 Tax=Aspergillus pseudotamarii TaxID=132259 RepID=A0A5N6SSU5_ASPPS|nr:uncharacterized protein BDV38DRAFT_248650 [Aspergillus pseudotamarii]KAE8136899.1 hypothetical protein BDV38DRAFT_248650 [Aspergillus pseudotamarii]
MSSEIELAKGREALATGGWPIKVQTSHVPSNLFLLPQSGSPITRQIMEYRLFQTMVYRRIYEEFVKPQATRTISVAS